MTPARSSQGAQVGNMALILRELVLAKGLTEQACEMLLLGLVARMDFLLGTPAPRWADLSNYTFPD
jgi:hypothetical protein